MTAGNPIAPAQVRALWHQLETINAVAYFAPECREAPARLGLRGFWMGYFACRAAPMGPVPPAVVEATFFNFHPARVRRAIPDAWTYASVGQLLAARAEAAAAALRRLLPGAEADGLAEAALPLLRRAVDAASGPGRTLFAANRDLAPPDDPVAAVWQAATTLREHRGDAHVALLVGAGVDGCEAHVLAAAAGGTSPEHLQQSRGWSADDWQAAVDGLAARGLVGPDGSLSGAGRELRDGIERRTDELAAGPYAALGPERSAALHRLAHAAAVRIAGSGDITYPNPMGLPRVEPARPHSP